MESWWLAHDDSPPPARGSNLLGDARQRLSCYSQPLSLALTCPHTQWPHDLRRDLSYVPQVPLAVFRHR